ncbi:DNA-binding SARP family transcriptional activator [Actinokineospora spheciospongiae]|nr:DNA-binding SARP family transcriptional activator [Actinokineospora spheciospongiae]
MQVRCLGPMVIGTGRREVVVRSSLRARVLVVLVVNAGDLVSRECLVDEVWPSDPPAGAVGSLHAHVSRLRGDLARWGVGDRIDIAAEQGGYRLRMTGVGLDVEDYEGLAATAHRRRRTAAGEVPELARAALRLWRGEPFEGLELGLRGHLARARLQESRMALFEALVDTALTSGRHQDVVAELRELTMVFPFREKFHEQLMVALYRCGRQVEAVQAFHGHRERISRELGLEPSPALRRRMTEILRHDPALWQAG